MKLFGTFYYYGCGFSIECASNVILILLITSLDIHLFNTFEKVFLLFTHFRI